ncbi:MAG TPA: AbrB/MazE/SpoVT family DNA-binding domain-containing protein [Verrucomicrobiae bacterium]|nr:AbrB/MazE/SpoVT family DNA-binding domain-containing protein [Verrucomicrobiae bacterium]
MSATVLREKRQTTLPVEVVEAAGLKPNDQVDWRFQDGEIRGRKLEPVRPIPRLKPLRVKGRLRPPDGFKPSRQIIAAAVRADRDDR